MHEQDRNNHNLGEVEALYIMATTDSRVGGWGHGCTKQEGGGGSAGIPAFYNSLSPTGKIY